MSAFHVGQKVVCVDDDFSPSWKVVYNRPIKGTVYTIREIVDWMWPDGGDDICFFLEEIINPTQAWEGCLGVYEHPFSHSRFRPVRITDISIFTAMLAPTPRVKVSS